MTEQRTRERLELVERVTRACVRHEAPVWECSGCQRASVIVVTQALSGRRELRGIAGARVLGTARASDADRYDTGRADTAHEANDNIGGWAR